MRPLMLALALLAMTGCQDKPTANAPQPTLSPTVDSCHAAPGDRCTALGEVGPWDGGVVSVDGKTLALSFVGFCGGNDSTYKAVTRETSTAVGISVYGARPYSNLCAGTSTVHVHLHAPLGKRTVSDDYTHTTHALTALQRVSWFGGTLDLPVPPSWTHRTGPIDLHYTQIYEVFTTRSLPPTCRQSGGSASCGLHLEDFRQGDAALIVKSNSALPGRLTYQALVGTDTTVAGQRARDLGTTSCVNNKLTCTTYALPVSHDDWIEIEFAVALPYPDEEAVRRAVLDGAVLTRT